MISWLIAGASLLVALLAWRRARQAARRLEQLSQMYWELKYQHGELRVRVERLAGGAAPGGAHAISRPPDAVIPLSSLRR